MTEARKPVMAGALLVLAVVAACVASTATAARDPLTGVWVAHDTAGDGSTDRYIFSGPDANGVRRYTLFDSYGTFCETDGAGTGSPLTGHGTVVLDDSTVTFTIDSYVCGNGNHGVFEPPLTGTGTLTNQGLDLGYYVAVRVGT